jgi:hypothetical protein
VGLSTRDFEVWLKRALEMEFLCLWELCEGNLEGGLWKRGVSFCGSSVKGTWRESSGNGASLSVGAM